MLLFIFWQWIQLQNACSVNDAYLIMWHPGDCYIGGEQLQHTTIFGCRPSHWSFLLFHPGMHNVILLCWEIILLSYVAYDTVITLDPIFVGSHGLKLKAPCLSSTLGPGVHHYNQGFIITEVVITRFNCLLLWRLLWVIGQLKATADHLHIPWLLISARNLMWAI